MVIHSLPGPGTWPSPVPTPNDFHDDDLVPPASSSVERDEVVRRLTIPPQKTSNPAALAACDYPNDRLDQRVIEWQFGVR